MAPGLPEGSEAVRRASALRPTPPHARAVFALSLSYLCPGWGHVYAGHRLRGLILLSVVAVLVLPAWVVAGTRLGGTAAGAVAVAAAWLLWVGVPFDAARRALQRRPPGGLTAAGAAAAFLVAGQLLLGAELELFRSGLVRLFHTPTPSMAPTVLPGDVLLADVRAAGRRTPVPGEIIVFRAPDDRAAHYTKRVVAGPGSVVELRAGRLVLDGEERSLASRTEQGRHVEVLGDYRYEVEVDRGGAPPDFGPVLVPAGHVFVLGDSRARSVDSRSFGAIPIASIEGRALRIVWSRREGGWRWERAGRALDPALAGL